LNQRNHGEIVCYVVRNSPDLFCRKHSREDWHVAWAGLDGGHHVPEVMFRLERWSGNGDGSGNALALVAVAVGAALGED
jgi:hypothetical protein